MTIEAHRRALQSVARRIRSLEAHLNEGSAALPCFDELDALERAVVELQRERPAHFDASQIVHEQVKADADQMANQHYIRDISFRAVETAAALPIDLHDIVRLRALHDTCLAEQAIHEGESDQAFECWRRSLSASPGDERNMKALAQLDGPTAEQLRGGYRLEEDRAFPAFLEQALGERRTRAIAIDRDGALYVDDIEALALTRLDVSGEVAWTIKAEDWSRSSGERAPIGFGALQWAGDRLLVCDTTAGELVEIERSGGIARVRPLPTPSPSCITYAPSTRHYVLTDEFADALLLLDASLRPLGELERPGPGWRPVQTLFEPRSQTLIVSFGMGRAGSLLARYDAAGHLIETRSDFARPPTHATKLCAATDGGLFLADHFGQLLRFESDLSLRWRHCAMRRVDRFRYVACDGTFLYLSDLHRLRRFAI